MTMVDTHTLPAVQVRRLLQDIADYQLARFAGCTYRIQQATGELDYDADRSVTERVDQLDHQHPGLITVIYPLAGEYEALWSLTDTGRAHLARLVALVHAVDPAEDPRAMCGHDCRHEQELPHRGQRVTCPDCRACLTRSARAWQTVLDTAHALRTLIGGTR